MQWEHECIFLIPIELLVITEGVQPLDLHEFYTVIDTGLQMLLGS